MRVRHWGIGVSECNREGEGVEAGAYPGTTGPDPWGALRAGDGVMLALPLVISLSAVLTFLRVDIAVGLVRGSGNLEGDSCVVEWSSKLAGLWT